MNLNQAPQQPGIEVDHTREKIALERQEAGKFVAERIKELMGSENFSQLVAVRHVYEEVKGHNYRQEEAAVKLLEYLAMANEVSLRKEELCKKFPGLSEAQVNPSSRDLLYAVE